MSHEPRASGPSLSGQQAASSTVALVPAPRLPLALCDHFAMPQPSTSRTIRIW
jgi:hypothetical protein